MEPEAYSCCDRPSYPQLQMETLDPLENKPNQAQQQAAALVEALLSSYREGCTPAAQEQALAAVADFMAVDEDHGNAIACAIKQHPDSGAVAAFVQQCRAPTSPGALQEALQAITSLAAFPNTAYLLVCGDSLDALVHCAWQASDVGTVHRAAAAVSRLAYALLQVHEPGALASALCSLLQRCMSMATTSTGALEHTLAAIHSLASECPGMPKAWCQHPGALQLTIRCLEHDSAAVLERTTSIFWALSVAEEACKTKLQNQLLSAEDTMLPSLMRCLCNSSSATVVGNALVSIGNMSLDQQSALQVLQREDLAAALTYSLGHADPKVVELATFAIGVFASVTNTEFHHFLDQDSTVELLASAIEKEQEGVYAATAVRQFVWLDASRTILLRSHILPALTRCLHNNNPRRVAAAADAIAAFAEHTDGGAAVVQEQTLAALVGCLEHQNPQVVRAAATAIANLLEDDLSRMVALQRSVILPPLVRALSQHCPDAKAEVLRAINNATLTVQGCWAFIQQEGALAALVACLGADSLKQLAAHTLDQLRVSLPACAPAIWDAVAAEVKANAEKAQLAELQRSVTEAVVGLAGRVRGTG